MRKHATTIVLVLLALALGVWLWLDRDAVTKDERKRRENSVFVAWRREELTEIRIDHDGELLVLERDVSSNEPSERKEGRWRMTSPRHERADAVAVEHLLTTLEFATVARKVGAGVALGLDAPRATGSVKMGALTSSFALGAPSPQPEGSSYFRVGEEAPVVIAKEVVLALLESSDKYRDRAVVPYLATELARFAVTRPDGGFVLERIDDRSFRLAGDGLLASRRGVEQLWAALAEMRAEAFPNEADADRLTAHPAVTIAMTPKDAGKPPAEIVIGEACPGHPADVVVLRRKPSRAVACAPKDVLAALQLDAATLVEKHLFTFGMDEIEELRLERTGPVPSPDAGPGVDAPKEIEIARKGTGWHARAPFDRDLSVAEADAASELVTAIAKAEAASVAPPTKGSAPFVATTKATVHLGELTQVIEIAAPASDGSATMRRAFDDARLQVSASIVRQLTPRRTTLRARTVLENETRRVTRVLLQCGTYQELVDKGEGFRLVAPPGYETDGSISQLVDGVLRGRIDAWVADGDDGSFGFTRDGCRTVLVFEDGNTPLSLAFGAAGEGGVYARADGIPDRAGIMVVPAAWRELAGRIYVSRGSLRTDASAIDHVRVTFEGKPAPPRDPAALREAVAGLYPDRVVALHGGARSRPDLVIEIALTEAGPPRRVTCWRPPGQGATESAGRSVSPSLRPTDGQAARYCAIDHVDATFEVPWSKLRPFVLPPEAPNAADAGDAGPAAGATKDAGPPSP